MSRRAQELAQDALGAIRSSAKTAHNAYVDEMVRRAEEWITELERIAADAERYREALDRVYQTGRGTHVEIARDALNDGTSA